MIWPLQLFPSRQRTPIQLSCLQRDDATSWSQNTLKHSISPPNWWRNRTCEPGTQNLFPDLLHKQFQNVEIIEPPHGIQPQPEDSFGDKTITILPHDGVWTKGYPLGIWEHQHIHSRTEIKDPQRSQKWGFRSTQTHQTTDGRTVYTRIYTLWERSEGMAWQKEPEDRIWIPKTCSKERRAFWDNRSYGTCHLLSKTSKPMANSPCLLTLSSTPLSYHPIKRLRPMAPTFCSLHLTLSKEKKSMKSKRSLHIGNEGKVTDTSWNGPAIPLPKTHGSHQTT